MREIKRETIQQIRALEQTLQTFWGFRTLWAETVANHVDNGLTAEQLDKKAREQLSHYLGQARNLADHCGLTWSDDRRMVAAAPRMLALLEKLIDFPCNQKVHYDVVAQATEIIKEVKRL